MRRSSRGFSVVELIVVIGIIGLLAAMLFPAISAARARHASLQCQSNLRTMGVAAHLHANEHRGYFPVAGLHWDLHLEPPGAEAFNDPYARRFTYFHDDGVQRPVPLTVALYVSLGGKVRLESREALEEDMQQEELRKHFRCPSQRVELKGLTQSIGPWQAPYEWSSYIFGEAVLGTRDHKLDFPRGKVSKVRRPSQVMLAMDGRPRQPPGSELNWLFVFDADAQTTLWDFHQIAMNPANDWCGREAIDFLRHNWRANVLYVDGHVESVPLTKQGMQSIGLSKGIYD